jgi:hypothetical protein
MALRTQARIAHVCDDPAERDENVAQAMQLVIGHENPLARAGLLLFQAETSESPDVRLRAAREAAAQYDALAMPIGVAHAHAFAAEALVARGLMEQALVHIESSADSYRLARLRVGDAAQREAFEEAGREVTARLVGSSAGIGSEAATTAANVMLLDMPMGVVQSRQSLEARQSLAALAAHIQSLGRPAHRAALARLGAQAALLDPDLPFSAPSVTQLRKAHPDAAVLLIGAPTFTGGLPVAFWAPGSDVIAELRPLSAEAISQIQELRASDEGDFRCLWQDVSWTVDIAAALLPDAVAGIDGDEPELLIQLHQSLGHIPVEALRVDGRALGERFALARLTTPAATAPPTGKLGTIGAFFDPALDWPHERDALVGTPGYLEGDIEDAVSLLGPDRLVIIATHGRAAPGLLGTLTTEAGTQVLDAADVLASDLRSSVLVLEACSVGRVVGNDHSEPLSLASAGLIAGASAVVAGTFPLPANPECTGRIYADTLLHLMDGATAQQAVRRARSSCLASAPASLPVPGADRGTSHSMDGVAPWAWSGVSVFV